MIAVENSCAPTQPLIPQTCEYLEGFIGRMQANADMLRAQADRRHGMQPEDPKISGVEADPFSAMDRLQRTMDRVDRTLCELSSQIDRNMGVA